MTFNICTTERVSCLCQYDRIDDLIACKLRGNKCPIFRQFLVDEFHFSAVLERLDPLFVWHFLAFSTQLSFPSSTLPEVPKTVFQGCLFHTSNARTTLHAAEREAHATAAFTRLGGAIRPADRFNTSSRADFAMRGFAISSWTLARVASPDSFLVFFFLIEHP
jgi:hypothetical protein